MANNLPDNLIPSSKPVVCEGNPVDGFKFIGPFDSHAQATDWGTRYTAGDWWIVDLIPPLPEELHGN